MTKTDAHKFFKYNQKTGKLFWRNKTGNRAVPGTEAGQINNAGYKIIGFKGKRYKAHQIIFMWMLGYFPKEVDHEDHNRLNNKWNNLKDATRITNMKNISKRLDNKSGITGVSWDTEKQRWRAIINVNKKPKLLGRFTKKADAVLARQRAEIKYGYHPNHGK